MMEILIAGAGRRMVGAPVDDSAPLAFGLPGVCTAAECADLIAKAEALGFDDAPITTAAGFVMRKDIRNNTRVMFDSHELAGVLLERIAHVLPHRLYDREPVGVNERFRIYRYDPGQRFAPHYDGCFQRDAHERSELTFMIYLNDGFEGGDTAFLDYGARAVPRTGAALFFQHYLLHEGCTIERGRKYVLRSDVMYADGSA
jgi:hypothetical protein